MATSAELVKELRETTGAGMMDCKKALDENNGDIEAAIDWLRKKGLSSAAKKAGRVAAEGLVGVAASGTSGVVIELNAETDFVARNEQFQQLVAATTQAALGVDTVEALATATLPETGKTVADATAALIGTIGENMTLRRMQKLTVQNGVVASYMHNAVAPNLGKIGVLVALESTAPAAELLALGKQIAMHIAATRPEALVIADVDPAKLERERAVLTEQASASGKPADVIAKMVEGRVRKYYDEVVLTEQVFVIDGERKISQVVADTAKQLGTAVALTGFARFQLGDGIEKQTTDFAAEVAAQAGLKAS